MAPSKPKDIFEGASQWCQRLHDCLLLLLKFSTHSLNQTLKIKADP
jgi:hypothetical protein